jgi:hypothetical protein
MASVGQCYKSKTLPVLGLDLLAFSDFNHCSFFYILLTLVFIFVNKFLFAGKIGNFSGGEDNFDFPLENLLVLPLAKLRKIGIIQYYISVTPALLQIN